MTHPKIAKGSRLYRCADCGKKQYMRTGEVNRRIRPRCMGCGGTFWEPQSDGAKENDTKAGDAMSAIEQAEKTGQTATNKSMQGRVPNDTK